MKKQILTGLSILMLAGLAKAECPENSWNNCVFLTFSTMGTTLSPFIATQEASGYLSDNHKRIIVAAKEDAMAYVATGGQVYGAQLAQAIILTREINPEAQFATDLQIAQDILAY